MENYIDLKYLELLILFDIPYKIITHMEDDFLYIKDVERFKKIKSEIEKLKEKYNGN